MDDAPPKEGVEAGKIRKKNEKFKKSGGTKKIINIFEKKVVFKRKK